MDTQKIALIGGPGTGKTTLINALKAKGYNCMEEISRQITLEAQEKGIDQLFLEDPLGAPEKWKSFDFKDLASLKEDFKIVGSTFGTADETWQMPWGEQLDVRNHYNELIVNLEEKSELKRNLFLLLITKAPQLTDRVDRI